MNGKTLAAHCDGGSLSSDAGLLALRKVERRLGVADRLAACIDDPRDPARTLQSMQEILRFRMLMFAAGDEHGNLNGHQTDLQGGLGKAAPSHAQPRQNGAATIKQSRWARPGAQSGPAGLWRRHHSKPVPSRVNHTPFDIVMYSLNSAG